MNSDLGQFRLLAKYNKEMNERLYAAASPLTHEELTADKGAFFKSVLGTLNHIMVGDIIWLQRFATDPSSATALAYLPDRERPASLDASLHEELDSLAEERRRIDNIIIKWIAGLADEDIARNVSYRNMAGKIFTKHFGSLITHLFLHQVHHRGQVTTLLSQYGMDFGDTDLIEFIPEYKEGKI